MVDISATLIVRGEPDERLPTALAWKPQIRYREVLPRNEVVFG